MTSAEKETLHTALASLERALASLCVELALLRGALYVPARPEDFEAQRRA